MLVFVDPVLFQTVFPYGLEIVRNELARNGISASVCLPYLTEDPRGSLTIALEQLKPKIVGFSFRNLDEAGFDYATDGEATFVDELVRLASVVKRFGTMLVLGGSGFGIAPTDLMRETAADFGFVGNSEADFAAFCARILQDGITPDQACAGLASVVRSGASAPMPNASPLGLPKGFNAAYHTLMELTGGTVGVRTKAGCTLRCTYCVVPWIEQLNLRPWSEIRSELQQVVAAGLGNRIFIADGEFNLPNADYAIDLCKKLQGEFKDQIEWRCYIDGGHVTEQLVAAMKTAGCVAVSITADSYSRVGRIGYAKGSTVEQVLDATRKFIDSGIGTTINVLFGGPKETIESAVETAEHSRRFHDLGAQIAVTVGLRVYPNTPLQRIAANPRFSRNYLPLKSYPWLGIFCSPVPPAELAQHVVPILPKGDRIGYTHTISSVGKAFYREIAIGAMLLAGKQYSAAHRHFSRLLKENPGRKEAQLGLVKAEIGLRGCILASEA
jgi:radical SAM superfamily enzyme YgiQ (UPF0313 family)